MSVRTRLYGDLLRMSVQMVNNEDLSTEIHRAPRSDFFRMAVGVGDSVNNEDLSSKIYRAPRIMTVKLEDRIYIRRRWRRQDNFELGHPQGRENTLNRFRSVSGGTFKRSSND
jgi:hypothetical protein